MTPGTQPSRLLRFLKEARRRRVYTTAAAYAVVSLGVIQGGQSLFDALLFPEWTGRAPTILMMLAFPVVLVLAWTFDIQPEGMQRTGAMPASGAEVAPPLAAAPSAAAAPTHAAAPSLGKRRLPFRAQTTRPRPLPPPAHSGSRSAPSGSAADAAGEPAAPPDPERVRKAALAHVRHELKTPVGAIIGYSEMLLEDAEESGEPEETRSDLRRIERAGKELLALIEEILHPDRVDVQGKKLDEFSARVRAALRTPINAVIGYAEMLIESARESGRERAVPDLERIRTAAHRLLELSNDIVQVATSARATSEAPTLAPTSAIAQGVLAKIRPARAGQTADDRQGSLLIVDDNEHNRDLLSRQLARMGYLVASEASGRAALKRIEEQAFDLVLLDIIMPEMDGIEVLRRAIVAARPGHSGHHAPARSRGRHPGLHLFEPVPDHDPHLAHGLVRSDCPTPAYYHTILVY
jgi:signal transduction histidine kinase